MRSPKRLSVDERGIEGLPIRLVIALVVGVAALSVMMGMLSGIDGLAVSEVDAKPSSDVVAPDETHSLDVTVVDPQGKPVSNATIVVRGDTATLERVRTGTTSGDGTASVSITPSLGPNQEEGSLEIDVKPPAGSEYTDKRANTEVLVVRGA
jgi:hypothetical protein